MREKTGLGRSQAESSWENWGNNKAGPDQRYPPRTGLCTSQREALTETGKDTRRYAFKSYYRFLRLVNDIPMFLDGKSHQNLKGRTINRVGWGSRPRRDSNSLGRIISTLFFVDFRCGVETEHGRSALNGSLARKSYFVHLWLNQRLLREKKSGRDVGKSRNGMNTVSA